MNWLLSRDTVIALALLGAVFALFAGVLEKRLAKAQSTALSWLAYACMGTSMLLFIVAGFVSPH